MLGKQPKVTQQVVKAKAKPPPSGPSSLLGAQRLSSAGTKSLSLGSPSPRGIRSSGQRPPGSRRVVPSGPGIAAPESRGLRPALPRVGAARGPACAALASSASRGPPADCALRVPAPPHSAGEVRAASAPSRRPEGAQHDRHRRAGIPAGSARAPRAAGRGRERTPRPGGRRSGGARLRH